jgi:hypothetical protein
MNKKATFAMALLIAGSVTALFSCSKSKDTNTDQLASLGTATVKGPVYAELVDTVGAAPQQAAPAGTVVHAWVDTRDLVLNPTSGEYAKKYYTATVGADGFYSFTIDVSKNRNATVHIEAESFMYDVTVKKMVGTTMTVTKETRPFTAASVPPVTVYSGFTAMQPIHYN